MQAGIFAAQQWAERMNTNRKLLIVKLDVRNAYNCISRHSCCEVADLIDPELGFWARWCLASPALLSCNGDPLLCRTGVQQGEPLSPLLFCAGLAPTVMAIADENPEIAQQWYLDDGCLCGEADLIARSLPAIEANLKAAHLELNHKKCEVYSFDPDNVPEG